MCLLDTRKDDRIMTVARNVLSSRVGRITARLRRYEGDADTCHKSEEPDDHARDSIWNTDVCNNGERSLAERYFEGYGVTPRRIMMRSWASLYAWRDVLTTFLMNWRSLLL